jgi:hypothetical protein
VLHGLWGPRLRSSIHRGWTGLFEHLSWLLGFLLGSRAFLALRWMTLKAVLGDVVAWCQLYMDVKPSHVGVDVDELSCPLHRSTTCSR